MSPPGSQPPRPRRPGAARRQRHAREAAAAREALGQIDRELLSALVVLVRHADVPTLSVARVIVGLTLRAARRSARRAMDPIPTAAWRPW